ncbi:ABC transporter permease [Spirochaetia bacterium]|nr:ABC transporter permease [Spirochaetia bacterium]
MEQPFPILHSAVTIMTPLLLAATGGLFTELAGVLNIALEGLLLTGAFTAIVCANFSGSITVGVLAAIAASMTLAALVGVVTLKLKSNVFITGLAANLFAAGITVVLSARLFATRGVIVFRDMEKPATVTLPGAADVPVIGSLFSGHTWYVYASWVLLFFCWIILYRTPLGFRLRSCKDHSQALVSLGINPASYQFAAFLISGFACGIGGSLLTLNLGVFVPNISAGKGWIALVVIFLGNRKPLGVFAAALIFGLADAFSNYAQGILNVPADFILAIPYIFTLVVLIGVSIYTKRKNRVL